MADRVGQQLGYYRLLRKIGQGSFAEVYLGEHQYLERLAAIKVLHVQIEPKTQEQFRREARTIAHLQHPHILQVLEFGIHDQTPYLVMEYTPGGTLRSQHPKGIRLSLEEIVTYVKQIASALDYAHQQRVIHRDVKLDNLLLNARHEIVLSDFGLAVIHRTLDSLSTQDPAGTPLYMAPEQIQRHPCAASDQYALGIIVYEWLVGEAPFRGTLFEVFSHHLSQPPPSLRERLPDLPAAVEEAVFKALAKDPEHRFACVADFASALEQACCATQPLSLLGRHTQQTHEQAVSQNTQLASASPAREQANGSFSTQQVLMTVQQAGPGQEGVSVIAPGLVPHRQPLSKQVKPSLAQSNRQRFLKRVRTFWIEGVLEHSLHGVGLIALGLQEQLDALANPWHLVLQHPDTAPRTLPSGTSITDVYDAANGELLILGAPGSGKTTLLLELARDLLDRAEQDEQQQMPVIFTLSSWAPKQQPLAEWLIEELISKYQVPRQLARTWVEADLILPLLDGLDEVAAEKRTACIETINTYRGEHGLLPLVVASRSADYLEQTVRLRLSSAVAIQSLTQQQVDDYLARGGESLWALRVALHQDASLRELTETPLLLSILTLTYHDLPVEELLRGGIAQTRQQIFEHYVARMLRYRGTEIRYPPEQTTHWLSWLAGQMKQHNQTVFYIEHLQPDWLTDRRRRLLYRLTVGLVSGLVSGLICGLVFWLVGILFFGLRNGLIPGLIVGLVSGLVFGLIYGLVGIVVFGLGQIKPREVLTRSWRGTKRSIVIGLVIGLGVCLFIGLGGWLVDALVTGQVGWLGDALSNGLIPGLIVGLVAILVAGFSTNQLDARLRLTPNQGIWRSARNGLVIGLLAWLIGGLVLGLVYTLFVGLIYGLVFGLDLGLVSGLVFGLGFGLGAFFQHFALRFWLWRAGSVPWNYTRFLDYAAERVLLSKVGGGYIFIHRLLLDYFASLETPSSQDVSTVSVSPQKPDEKE